MNFKKFFIALFVVIVILLVITLGLFIFVKDEVLDILGLKGPDWQFTPLSDIQVGARILYTSQTGEYSFMYPQYWEPNALYDNLTVFTISYGPKDLENPDTLEAAEIDATVVTGITEMVESNGATTKEEWFVANGLSGPNKVIEVKDLKETKINGYDVTRIIQLDPNIGGDVLHYIYFSNDGKVISLSQHPYLEGSQASGEFELAAESFVPKNLVN